MSFPADRNAHGRSRRPFVPVLVAILLGTVGRPVPAAAQSQGPSLALKEIWLQGEDRDIGPFLGVEGTVRPPGRGVALSIEWLKRHDLTLLAGYVGYSLPLLRGRTGQINLRPAIGIANIRTGPLGKSLLSLNGTLEASQSLFGLEGWRVYVAASGAANIAFQTRHCPDCILPTYENGFQSLGASIGFMRVIQ